MDFRWIMLNLRSGVHWVGAPRADGSGGRSSPASIKIKVWNDIHPTDSHIFAQILTNPRTSLQNVAHLRESSQIFADPFRIFSDFQIFSFEQV